MRLVEAKSMEFLISFVVGSMRNSNPIESKFTQRACWLVQQYHTVRVVATSTSSGLDDAEIKTVLSQAIEGALCFQTEHNNHNIHNNHRQEQSQYDDRNRSSPMQTMQHARGAIGNCSSDSNNDILATHRLGSTKGQSHTLLCG
jgi:hypothetical protein